MSVWMTNVWPLLGLSVIIKKFETYSEACIEVKGRVIKHVMSFMVTSIEGSDESNQVNFVVDTFNFDLIVVAVITTVIAAVIVVAVVDKFISTGLANVISATTSELDGF